MTTSTNGPSNGIPKSIQNGWFSEVDSMLPGQQFSLALEEFSEKSILYNKQSEFQSILVFKSAQYGNVLVLDGVLQLTERDEFSYHEMMAHLPLFSHVNPKRVLIVGGGDGGLLKQVCRHASVESITMVEIDTQVIHVAKQYFANSTAAAFDDDRLTLIHDMDGFDYMQSTLETFDVIIADALDPIGPGETIFTPDFYECMYKSLNHGGVACVQSECIWINLNLISDVVHCCNDIFDFAEYATANIPSFPCGQTGFILGRKGHLYSCQHPVRLPSRTLSGLLKWYNPAMHHAAFQLPEFVRAALEVEEQQEDRCFVGGCDIL